MADTETTPDYDAQLAAAAKDDDFEKYHQIYLAKKAAQGNQSLINGQPSAQVLQGSEPPTEEATSPTPPSDPQKTKQLRQRILDYGPSGQGTPLVERNKADLQRYNDFLSRQGTDPNRLGDSVMVGDQFDPKGRIVAQTMVPPTINQQEHADAAVAQYQAMESNMRNAAIAAAKAGRHDIYENIMDQLLVGKNAIQGGNNSQEYLRKYFLGRFQQPTPYQNFYSSAANTNGFNSTP